MRLLLCCENYPPSVGGVQEVMRQVAERLARRGHEVTVFTGVHRDRPARAEVGGVQVRSFGVTGNLVRGLRGEVEPYRRAVLEGGHDAVLIKAAQQWTFDAIAPELGRLAARKVFIPCGFSGLYDRGYRDYFRQMPEWLRAFDALVFYSGTYRDIEFARAHGVVNLHVIPNGVDEREFGGERPLEIRRELGIAPEEFTVFTVGTLVAGKGHWELLEAFERANLSGRATLVVNGNDPYLGAPIRRLAAHVRTRRLPLRWLAERFNRAHAGKKRVVIVDLARPALVKAYAAADLFVLASHVEYSPLVLFEAAAAGTPFLSSPAGNAREIAEWTQGGWVYDAPVERDGRVRTSPSKLAIRLEECQAMGAELRARGAVGRGKVLTEGFTWEAIAPRYEAVLAGVPL